ncbi:MAG TPA: hypothetical protein VK157_02090 [Phycisphaerales bacterium]|nr:hypothetical protein [Phycisphaerales bacterium]
MADQSSRSEYDALADLFLAADAPREPRPVTYTARATHGGPALRLADLQEAPATQPIDEPVPATNAAPSVEALVLGHLPVLGSAWVTQYAKHVAEERRTSVALLRVHEGQAWVDIVTPRTAPARTHSRVGEASAEPQSLDAALARAARECSHWLVRVDEIAEPQLVTLPHLARVTLLTGADDAAVVASYRTIKSLSRSLDAARVEDDMGPSLKLAIMGADDAKATEAESKLRKAAATFLQNELEPAAKVAKIGGSSTLALYRGPATLDVATMLANLSARNLSPQPQEETPAPATQAAAPAVEAPVEAPAETVSAAPASTPTAQPAALPIAGLVALSITCPYAKTITLAVSSDNALHLIAPATTDAAQSLLAAAAWAHDHAQLLALAHPGLRCDEPTLHVLAHELRDARALLDTAIAVHLVVQLGDTTVAKRLN